MLSCFKYVLLSFAFWLGVFWVSRSILHPKEKPSTMMEGPIGTCISLSFSGILKISQKVLVKSSPNGPVNSIFSLSYYNNFTFFSFSWSCIPAPWDHFPTTCLYVCSFSVFEGDRGWALSKKRPQEERWSVREAVRPWVRSTHCTEETHYDSNTYTGEAQLSSLWASWRIRARRDMTPRASSLGEEETHKSIPVSGIGIRALAITSWRHSIL